MEVLKIKLGRWLNNEVPDQTKFSVLWIAAAIDKMEMQNKMGSKYKTISHRESEMVTRQLERLRMKSRKKYFVQKFVMTHRRKVLNFNHEKHR